MGARTAHSVPKHPRESLRRTTMIMYICTLYPFLKLDEIDLDSEMKNRALGCFRDRVCVRMPRNI
eukprot:225828-Pleurochrysis_carterae.AAC.1